MGRYGATPTNLTNQSAPAMNDYTSGGGGPPFGISEDIWNQLTPEQQSMWLGYGGANYDTTTTGAKLGRMGYDGAVDDGLRYTDNGTGYPGGGIRRPSGRVSPDGLNQPVDGGIGYFNTDYQDINLPYDLNMDSVSFEEDRARYEQAYMDRARGLLDPIFSEKQMTLDEKLANRGMPTGSEETEILQGRLGREQTDAYTKTALDAILAGGAETRANRGMTLGERLSQFGASSQARNQMFGEQNQEFNQLASILGMSQIPQFGGSQPFGIDMNSAYGMYGQNRMFQQQQQSDFWGGLLGLGGMLGSAFISDANLKYDIRPVDADWVLDQLDDLDVSSWKYRFDNDSTPSHIGPMAQDFNALFGTPSEAARLGFETLDVVSVMGVLLAAVKALKHRVDELEGGA